MNVKSVEVCVVIAVLAVIGFFFHLVDGINALLGNPISIISVLSLIFMVFNIFVFSGFRVIANICGVYAGHNRFLKARRLITYLLGIASIIGVILYRMHVIELLVAGEILNLTMAFVIINCYGFGKTRGAFLWNKYI